MKGEVRGSAYDTPLCTYTTLRPHKQQQSPFLWSSTVSSSEQSARCERSVLDHSYENLSCVSDISLAFLWSSYHACTVGQEKAPAVVLLDGILWRFIAVQTGCGSQWVRGPWPMVSAVAEPRAQLISLWYAQRKA